MKRSDYFVSQYKGFNIRKNSYGYYVEGHGMSGDTITECEENIDELIGVMQ